MHYIVIERAFKDDFIALLKKNPQKSFLLYQLNAHGTDQIKIRIEKLPQGSIYIIDDFLDFLKQNANFQYS